MLDMVAYQKRAEGSKCIQSSLLTFVVKYLSTRPPRSSI